MTSLQLNPNLMLIWSLKSPLRLLDYAMAVISRVFGMPVVLLTKHDFFQSLVISKSFDTVCVTELG